MKPELFQLDPLSFFSHELKTPLSTLQLSLNLLEQDFEKNKSLIPIMKQELEFLIRLITDGLDLRAIEQKKEILNKQWIDFDSLVQKNLLAFKPLARQKNVSFKVEGGRDLELFADPLWISCVLKNLLANALAFCDKNSSIFIKWDKKASSGLEFSIKNQTALKFSTKKVFDNFYTKSLDTKKSGTGLGLSLVQAIIKAHKGQIRCLKDNSSVEFIFSLPKNHIHYKKSA